MDKEELWRKFGFLPAERQQEVVDFIEFLRTRTGRSQGISDNQIMPPITDGKNGRHFSFSKDAEHLGTRVDTRTEVPVDRRFKL